MQGIQILVDRHYLVSINCYYKIIVAHSDFVQAAMQQLDTFPLLYCIMNCYFKFANNMHSYQIILSPSPPYIEL